MLWWTIDRWMASQYTFYVPNRLLCGTPKKPNHFGDYFTPHEYAFLSSVCMCVCLFMFFFGWFMNFMNMSCPVCMQLLPFDIQRPSFIRWIITYNKISPSSYVALFLSYTHFRASIDLPQFVYFSFVILFRNGSMIAHKLCALFSIHSVGWFGTDQLSRWSLIPLFLIK